MTDPTMTRGPALSALLAAQGATEEALEFPALEKWATALVAVASELGYPELWAVSAPAERLVGAAVLLGRGKVRARSLGEVVEGRRVLLVEAVAVSALQLLEAAGHARRQRAQAIAGCAIALDSDAGVLELDGFVDLQQRLRRLPRRSRLAAA